ncbi:ribbon-helix-helix domain-containing protein [Thermococcus pacificus]|uniref:CopG family transcriptional regulator n=1 Tax=Thermococcus pacificus TaxID=71998 RepID=A0A218PA16_9EURY|nr:ribbon-helix-helix domain-containing protein [Thermococcus pacificus]ASJ07590.1 CopG family transcriptional regulator [Thermococcus pacificus]
MGTSVKITARIPPALVAEIDRLVNAGYYSNRSEVIKEALRDFLVRKRAIIEEAPDEEFIRLAKRAIEPILAEDWESEADEYWDKIKGVRYEQEM